jgi:hypothetical protein
MLGYPACAELVSLTIGEYEFIRRIPIRLVVRPGHVHNASERVLMEEPGRFLVVENRLVCALPRLLWWR